MKTTKKSPLGNFSKQLHFREIYEKYLEKKQYILHGFLQYQFAIKSKANNKHSIHM